MKGCFFQSALSCCSPQFFYCGLIQLVDQDKMSPENKKVVGFLNQSAQELDEIICKTVERAS
jgi:hypothetical protein